MSLADELLADLEEGGEDIEQDEDEVQAEIADVEEITMDMDKQYSSVSCVAKLRDSKEVIICVT